MKATMKKTKKKSNRILTSYKADMVREDSLFNTSLSKIPLVKDNYTILSEHNGRQDHEAIVYKLKSFLLNGDLKFHNGIVKTKDDNTFYTVLAMKELFDKLCWYSGRNNDQYFTRMEKVYTGYLETHKNTSITETMKDLFEFHEFIRAILNIGSDFFHDLSSDINMIANSVMMEVSEANTSQN